MPDRLIGVLIGAFFGIGALTVGVWLRDRQRRLRDGVVVTARIVGTGDSGRYWAGWYVVAYPVLGAVREGKVSRVGVPRQRVGTTLEVVYDADHPERIAARGRLDTRIDTLLIWALLVLGGFMCVLAAVGLASG